MIKSTLSINEVKSFVSSLKNKPVKVKINLGRNKQEIYEGVLTGVYPALFTITPKDSTFLGKTTYSYSEFLCGRVRIKEQTKNI